MNDKITIEESLNELDDVIKKLEDDRISLEEALCEYERGVNIVRKAKEIIDGAKTRIEIIAAGDYKELNESGNE